MPYANAHIATRLDRCDVLILRKFIGLITIPSTDIAKFVGYLKSPFTALPILRRDSIHRSKLSSKEPTQGNFFVYYCSTLAISTHVCQIIN
jgi:hypothetical protein